MNLTSKTDPRRENFHFTMTREELKKLIIDAVKNEYPDVDVPEDATVYIQDDERDPRSEIRALRGETLVAWSEFGHLPVEPRSRSWTRRNDSQQKVSS